MFWFWTFFAAVFVLAYGTGMLSSIERRRAAVARNQKHSVTGEPLVEFEPMYSTVAKVVAWIGAVFFVGTIVAFMLGMEPLF